MSSFPIFTQISLFLTLLSGAPARCHDEVRTHLWHPGDGVWKNGLEFFLLGRCYQENEFSNSNVFLKTLIVKRILGSLNSVIFSFIFNPMTLKSTLDVVSMVIWLWIAIGTIVVVMEDVTPVMLLVFCHGTNPLRAKCMVVIVALWRYPCDPYR